MEAKKLLVILLSALAASLSLTVSGSSHTFPNNPPIIAGLPDHTVMVGQTIPVLDLFIYASDTEDYDNDLVFSIESQTNPSAISCFVTGNGFMQCGTAQTAGFSDITVKVTDTGGLSATDIFRITVQGSLNTPPMISGVPDSTISLGQTIPSIDLFGFAFDQQDTDSALTFSIDSQSDGNVISCSIASNRYVQCGTGQEAGFTDIIIRVTDTDGLSDTDIFRITVQGSPVNTVPVISGLPDSTISVRQTIPLVDLFAHASDSQDPDTALSFSIDSESNPSVISCYVTGNRFVGCGAGQAAGFSDITVRVTDTGGLSATDTFRITVQAVIPSDHAPVMNSVVITPSNPQDTDSLTCTAQVSDQDGNLQSVQFKWFVNAGLDKTRTIQASGSSATTQDTLDSGQSTLGDEVKCQATVFDATGNQDTGFDTVTIQRQGCGVDVSSLQVTTDDNIRFQVRNTAASIQSVTYDIFIDGLLAQENTITLNPGEVEIVQLSHAFGIGSFIVKAKATAQCGATDSESITHDVLNPCPTTSACPGPQEDNPKVDSVRITPSDPEEGDDLTCRIEVSDNEGDLDEVRVKWFVEGDLERTRTIFVSGSSDDVQDTLNTGWFGRGRDVRCEATVFDRDGREDTDSDTVTIGGEQESGCGVDVYSLELIQDNEIRFRIRNTGDRTEDITYKIYVESNVFDQHTITLDEGESQTFEESFTFDIRDFIVKVKATADCGAIDSEFLSGNGNQGACIARYLDDYMCSGSWVQRRYQYSDCSTNWVNFEYCSSGCSSGSCTGTGGSCGVSIRRFEYQTSVVAGNAAFVTVEARNTANRQETITLSLWVDGQLKESFPSSIASGAVSLRTFYYYPSAGTHQILAKAETSCGGSSDTRTATVSVFQQNPTPTPYPTPQPQPAPSLPTAVSIYPSSLDTSLCGAKFVTIDIHNAVEQVYTIQVTGIPADWLSYQSQNVVVQGDRQLFVYVGPKASGTYNIKVTVTAGTEGKTYQQDVSVFTASCPQTTGTGWSITGSLIDAGKSPLFWIVLIIIAGAIVIFVGATRLRPDEEYYEPAYPYRRFRPLPKK